MRRTRSSPFVLSMAAACLACAAGGLGFARGLPPPPQPPGNPATPAKVLLGKALFFEEQLSATKTMSCATCHRDAAGGADPRGAAHPGADGAFATDDDVIGSPGVVFAGAGSVYTKQAPFPLEPQVTPRRAPSVINAAFAPELFWDGRAGGAFHDPQSGALLLPSDAALESQASEPPVSAAEMAHFGDSWATVAARVAAAPPLALAQDLPPALEAFVGDRGYPELFRAVFGDDQVTPARIVSAIAAYERTLISDQSPYDAFLGGDDRALDEQQLAGLAVLDGKGKCFLCHSGGLFTSHGYFNIGIEDAKDDPGRAAVTGDPADAGKFKTPGLRNLALREFFFHDGSARTLEDVIDFYDRGGDVHDEQSDLVKPIGLSDDERAAVLAFLATGLLDPRVAAGLPPFDAPLLYTESDRVPEEFGAGIPGAGGIVPRFVALEPPMLGNAAFTLAVDGGLPGALAFLVASGAPLVGGPAPLGTPLVFPLGALLTVDGTAGDGHRALQGEIPRTAALDGQELWLRAFVLDPNAAHGVAATPDLRIRFFAPR